MPFNFRKTVADLNPKRNACPLLYTVIFLNAKNVLKCINLTVKLRIKLLFEMKGVRA
jgi:hypothetical protein